MPTHFTFWVRRTLGFCLLTAFLFTSGSSTLDAQASGEWSAVGTKGVNPEKRHESAFVELDGLFYLIGGRGTRPIQVFDPDNETWTDTKSETKDIHHFQARGYGGKIYLLGALTGNYPNEDPTTNVLIYDPKVDKLLQGPTIPAGRRRGSSGVVLHNGSFYIVAGNRNGHSAFLDDDKTIANVTWTDKFNPSTGEWTVLPDAPHARDHFFAEVIGNRMYVAGGRRSRFGTDDGTWKDTEVAVDVFDFTTDQWLTGNDVPADLPTARAGAATAVLGNELLVIGGEIANNPPNNLALPHTEVMNASTGKWRRDADLKLQRHATQAIVHEGTVYLAAGSKTKGGTEITAGEVFMESFAYDGVGSMGFNDWTTIGSGEVPRSEATAISYGGEYYMFNGFDSEIDIYNRVEKYNPATNTYTLLSPMPTVDGKLTAVTHNGITLVDDQIWIIGGRVGDHPGRVTDEVWIYDISEDKWSMGPKLPARRGGGGVGRLGRRIHYVGGFDQNASCDVADHLVYDLDDPQAGWQDYSMKSPMPNPRNHISVAVLDGLLYVIGGQYGHDGCGGGKDLDLVHAYDPVADSWKRVADLPFAQSHNEPSTFLHDGKIIVAGGSQSGGKNVWEYEAPVNKWNTLDQMQLPEALLAPVARVHRGNMVVLNGGKNVFFPTTTTRVKKFTPNDNAILSFNRKQLEINLEDGQSIDETILLSNLNGEASTSYSIDESALPSWLSVGEARGYARESFAEVQLTIEAAGLNPGTYAYSLEAISSGYQSAIVDISLTVKGNGGAVADLWLEAECAEVGGQWEVVPDAKASGGSYVAPPAGENFYDQPPGDVAANQISFTVLTAAGGYHLFARILAPSSQDDSFWVRVNGGDWIKWWNGLDTNGDFAWREVDLSPFTLPEGESTIEFAFREDGTLLDKIYLSTSNKQPQGVGGQSSNCQSTEPPAPTTVVRINAGGPATQYLGNSYEADRLFSGGKTYQNASAEVPALYQSERSSEAPFQYAYNIPVPNGNYTIRLHFAEIYFGATGGGPGGNGKRVFDVTLEDELVLDNYDINADVGPQTTTVKEYEVTVEDGSVTLFLDASGTVGGTNQPKLSALEVIGSGGTLPPPPSDPVDAFWAEAECPLGGSDWTQIPNTSASEGQYRVFPGKTNEPAPQSYGGARQLTYDFELTEEDTYALYLRLRTPSKSENSFWVSVDDGPWIKYWKDKGGALLYETAFTWKEVLDDGQPITFDLDAGEHTIRVAPRETGTQLDKLYLGRLTAGAPGDDFGEAATNCTSGSQTAKANGLSPNSTVAETSVTSLTIYPNPARGQLNFVLEGFTNAEVILQIFDVNGRVMIERSYNLTTDRIQGDISTAALPAGTYHLRSIDRASGQQLNRAFVKLR